MSTLMRIGALNVGHQVRKPKEVAEDLLDDILALDADLFFMTEYVETDAYRAALEARWPHVMVSPQIEYAPGRFNNQVTAVSRFPLEARPVLEAVPDTCAIAGFLSVGVEGLVASGIRAPYYERASDWYTYWSSLGERLDGHVAIGDLNVDTTLKSKRHRVLPAGWTVVTPPGGPSYLNRGTQASSNVDHALVRGPVRVVEASYHPEFFERHERLDHCPIVVTLECSNP